MIVRARAIIYSMDMDNIANIVKIILSIGMFATLIYILVHPKKRTQRTIPQPTHQGFLCESFELLDKKSADSYQIQIFGQAGMRGIEPADTITVNDTPYTIVEVYDAESPDISPSDPAPSLPVGHTGVVVVCVSQQVYSALRKQTYTAQFFGTTRYFRKPIECAITSVH